MKRKLALLLAGTMVLSTVSTNTIFAANGEVTSGSNMQVGVKTKTNYTANLNFGDGNQTFTSNSAFSLELVNGKWVDADDATTTTVDETDLADDFKKEFISGVKYNASLTKTTTRPNFQGTYTVTDASKPTYVKVTSTNVAGFQEAKQIQLTNPGQTSENNVTVTSVDGTLSSITGAKVTINSDVANGIKPNETYTLSLPSGYEFTNKTASVTVTPAGGTAVAVTPNYSSNLRTMTITVPSTYADATGSAFGGVIEFSNIDITNKTNDFNKDVNVTVKKGNTVLAEKKIAKFQSYGVSAKVTTAKEDIPTINAGYQALDAATSDQALNARSIDSRSTTAEIKISENIPNSFRGGDIVVTLPEDVEITGFKAVGTNSTVGAGCTVVLDKDDSNIMYIKGLTEATAGTAFALTFALEIQTPANFNGDVSATISGGKNTVDVISPIKLDSIATVKSVVGVEAKASEVLAGYTNQKANDIVITEKEANTFEVGETITIDLVDGFKDGRYSNNFGFSNADVEVTSGDADIEVDITKDNKIEITIEDINSDKPLQFTVKNVQVFSDRNVPTYNGSDAIKYSVTSDENLTVAAEGDYIKFVSEMSQDASTAAYNKDVVITLNGTSATLEDGTKVDLYGAPYISADGNYMAPVKGFAYALGLTPEDIVFDNDAKIATFFLADGTVGQIQAGNKYATVNGQNLPLIDANGNIVTPVIKEGRFYLPLRACAKTMFGVDVDYNATDKSVVLNPTTTK